MSEPIEAKFEILAGGEKPVDPATLLPPAEDMQVGTIVRPDGTDPWLCYRVHQRQQTIYEGRKSQTITEQYWRKHAIVGAVARELAVQQARKWKIAALAAIALFFGTLALANTLGWSEPTAATAVALLVTAIVLVSKAISESETVSRLVVLDDVQGNPPTGAIHA